MHLFRLLFRDKNVSIIAFVLLIPPDFIGKAIDIPSGISCKAIATARDIPSLNEAPNPEPIANPSGKL